MKNKIKYFLIIVFSLSIFLAGFLIYIFFLYPSSNLGHDCDTELDIYRWDLKVFRPGSNQNIDSLIKKIKIEMDPVFSFTEEDYKDLMKDQNFQIISDSTYDIFNTRLPYLEEINEGFCRYKEEFLEERFPDPNIIVYLDDYITQVANPNFSPPFFPVDYNINNEDNTYWVSLGLNWFLGEQHSFYQSIPDYVRNRYDSVYITPMIFHQLGYFHIQGLNKDEWEKELDETLLASMISTAKPYFFAKYMLPDAADYRVFGFTVEEMDFAYENETLFWKEILLTDQLIYSSDRELKDLYIIPGPNLNCPTRLGTWLGFRILDSYFTNNDVSLQDILLEFDFQKILNQSNYQP